MRYEFIAIEDLKVGDVTGGAEVTAIRTTAKRVYFTVNGHEWHQAKGTRISKLVG